MKMKRIRRTVLGCGLTVLAMVFAAQTAMVHAGQALKGASKATSLIGKPVHNSEGKDLGEIQDLVINWRDGGVVEYAVLSFGGFLGIGDKYFAIPWVAMALSDDKEHFILNVKEERLKKAPGFDKNNWPDMSNHEWALVIYQFYELDPNAIQAAKRSPSAGGSQKMKGEDQAEFTNDVREAIHHAMEAKSAGTQGKADALVKHAKTSLDLAKQAQRHGHNERLNEGVYALGDAIEHGQKKQTTDATEHMMHAIMKLSQAAGLQIPQGVATGRTPDQ
ncbi:MAG: small metal-binding protein SmbP [Nitrospira sp.]